MNITAFVAVLFLLQTLRYNLVLKERSLFMFIVRIATFILSVFIVGMVEMMVAGIMNLMSHDLNVSEAVIGQLVTMYALTFAI